MTRMNALRNITKSSSFQAISGTLNALLFAAVLIVCSIAVGCSSDKPKPVSSTTQISMTPAAPALPSVDRAVPPAQAPKPAARKAAPKKPSTVSYTDKPNGVTFEYPRRYAIDTGKAAAELVLSNPVPLNFVAPGGVALAAVELPETGYDNTDFSSAFFSVSVNSSLTADQCTAFAVPQSGSELKATDRNVARASSLSTSESAPAAQPATDVKAEKQVGSPQSKLNSDEKSNSTAAQPSAAPTDSSVTATTEKPADQLAVANPQPAPVPLEFKDMQPRSTEAVSGEGTRQSDSRYFHVYRNGSCYEFALNVTTNANGDGLTKHIDRDRVFARLEKILDTVKLEATTASAETQEGVQPDAPTASPAQ